MKSLADAVWAKGVMSCTPGEALKRLGISPDFVSTETDPGTGAVYIHRRAYKPGFSIPDVDWYFVALNNDRAKRFEASFRVSGRIPEIWDAEKGTVYNAPQWHEENGRTVVTFEFPPSGSAFVVVRKLAPIDSVKKVEAVVRRSSKSSSANAQNAHSLKIVSAFYGHFDKSNSPVKGSSVDIKGILSAKIYRVGVLLYGVPPKFLNIIKMIFKKS